MDFAMLVEDIEAGPPSSSSTAPPSLLLSPTPRSKGSRVRMPMMRRRRRPFQAGDLAIVAERHDSFVPIYLTPGEKHMTRFGAFHHDDILGRPFGARVRLCADASVAIGSPAAMEGSVVGLTD